MGMFTAGQAMLQESCGSNQDSWKEDASMHHLHRMRFTLTCTVKSSLCKVFKTPCASGMQMIVCFRHGCCCMLRVS